MNNEQMSGAIAYLRTLPSSAETFVGQNPQAALIAAAILVVLAILSLVLMGVSVADARRRQRALHARFKPVLDVEAEVERLKGEVAALHETTEQLRANYQTKLGTFHRLEREVAIFDERISFSEWGVYEPHFDFGDSETYKAKILEVRDTQKKMVSGKTAVLSHTDWTVQGSKSKGRSMVNRQMRLTLRAFNNEAEAAIANVRWNNANAMEKRIQRAGEQIDKLNASLHLVINPRYAELKLRELWLTHEMREKIKVEKDERAEARRRVREEERLVKEAEDAQREEDRYEKLLAKARSEAAAVTGEKLDAFREQIAVLERDLAEAHARADRAKAMAEQTRVGHVYVISNIGSFGEDIVKIGLTRRLDPLDRIRELGDASVPFIFDTHALIYSEDAPTLETALHRAFEDRRVNAANMRKEFFRVSLDEIEQAVNQLAPDANFFRDREAQDYRETLALRHQKSQEEMREAERAFPAEL